MTEGFRAFVEHQFGLSQVVDKQSKLTLRDQLTSASYSSDKAEELLLGPGCPAAARHLWDIFLALHASRGSNGYGGLPISFMEIDAYQRLTGAELSREEVGLLRAADATALRVMAEHDEPTATEPTT